MQILHTSDWHLGQSFMGRSRKDEHQAFLSWLLDTIDRENITLLIVAGDIFDTGTPPNYALEIYYNFLTKLSNTTCCNIIIIAGNHDSIATLKAPKELLKALNIDLISSGDESEDEIVPIYRGDELEAIVCAVPFLRDYVVRKSLSKETLQQSQSALTEGIKEHYKSLYYRAKELQGDSSIPIIATGHLTTVGSRVSDSEREIYIGGTLNIDGDFLSGYFDYVALGHLHINQKVGCEYVRYSGSPIPLSFGEGSSQKRVNIVKFLDTVVVEELEIPLYRTLLQLKGSLESIVSKFDKIEDKRCWVEVYVDDDNPFYADQIIRERAKELGLELLAVKIDKKEQSSKQSDFDVISLDELEPMEVFLKRLDSVDKRLKDELVVEFKNILKEVELS